MKRMLILFFLITQIIDTLSQGNKYGVPFIENYPTQITQGSEQNWCITEDKFGYLYFGNQDRGVIRYDGTKWSGIQINNNPRIYSLASDDRGIVYVGAAFEFGYIQPDKKGTPEYISLAARLDSISEVRLVFSIVVRDNIVFFLSTKFIYLYDFNNDSLSKIDLSSFNLADAYRLVEINDKLILADNTEGIFELKDTLITPLPGGDFFKKKICSVLLPYDEKKILVGTFFDGLFLYDYSTGNVRSDFINEQLNKRLKIVNIYAAALLNEYLFAIGTTNEEGILIFNRSGELVQQIKKENCDLEDDAIMALYCNYKNKSELWISTFGVISKAYFNLPLTKFSEKQGIDYGVNGICEFQDNIYLASDAGILKSYTDDQNNIRFKKIPGTDSQFFPIKVIKTTSGEFLLAGSLNGVLQILKNDVIRKVEENCTDIAKSRFKQLKTREIVQSSVKPDIVYFGLEVGGIVILRNAGDHWNYINRIKGISGAISGIVEKEEGGLWFITDDPSSLNNVSIKDNDTLVTRYGPQNGVPDIELNSLHSIKGELYVTTSLGILKYDKPTDKFISDNSLTGGFSGGKFSWNLFLDIDEDIWYSGIDNKKNIEVLVRKTDSGTQIYQGILNLLPSVPSLDFLSYNGKIFLTKSKMVPVLDKANLTPDSTRVNTYFADITIGSDSVVMTGSFYRDIDKLRRIPVLFNPSVTVPEYRYDMNEVTFEWTTPYFTGELQTDYSYILEGFDENWSKWEGISFGYDAEALYPKAEYTNLPSGHYTFRVRTRTLTGLTGDELKYEFIILKPWYATIFALIGFILAAFLIVYAIIAVYTRRLKNENIRLEGIVADRTAVVVKQKEELESSIQYASRIQMALLPSDAILSEYFKNYFVLFKPRDIVSGDFYWMTKKGERLYIVAADCTGHGVPGAFMSLLGMSFLDEIIDKDDAPRADAILNDLRIHVTESLKQVGDDNEAKDGMDIALLVIDSDKRRIEFSGAYNPCYRVRKLTGEEARNYKEDTFKMSDGFMSNGKYLLDTIYASKMPIGISSKMDEGFVFYDWTLEKGISYYMFSDGYVDQFGGPKGRKFMKKNFKRLILDIQDYPMNKQKDILEKNLKDWMGKSPQIDDILVMGIKPE
jgi:serine phosphatase RsbU (regulator of sigma subunit)